MKPWHEKSPTAPADAGYTIIEVLIALAIFSIGIMAMGALQAASLRTTGDVARMSEALALLDDRAEQLKIMPFYSTDPLLPFPSFDPVLTDGVHLQNRGRYDVHWEVDDNVPLPQRPHTQLSYVDGLPAGWYTVSKTITVWVTRTGDAALEDALAITRFVKTWAAQTPAIP